MRALAFEVSRRELMRLAQRYANDAAEYVGRDRTAALDYVDDAERVATLAFYVAFGDVSYARAVRDSLCYGMDECLRLDAPFTTWLLAQ